MPIVVATRAEAGVEIERVAVLEVLGRADAADGVATRRPDVGEAQDAALELDVGEQVGEAEVLEKGMNEFKLSKNTLEHVGCLGFI